MSRSRPCPASSTTGPTSPPETRETVLEVVRQHGLHDEPQRTRALRRPHRPRRGDHPDRPRRVLLGHPLRRRRGALRAGHAHRPLPDAARARARGDAARPADARDDRRRAADAPGGVERRAEGADVTRLPVRRRRSDGAAGRRHRLRLGGERVRREGGHRAPARARPPPHRRDHRPADLAGEPGADQRLPRRARRCGDRARPQPRDPVQLRDRGRLRRGREAARPCPTGRRRSSASTTTSPSA